MPNRGQFFPDTFLLWWALWVHLYWARRNAEQHRWQGTKLNLPHMFLRWHLLLINRKKPTYIWSPELQIKTWSKKPCVRVYCQYMQTSLKTIMKNQAKVSVGVLLVIWIRTFVITFNSFPITSWSVQIPQWSDLGIWKWI